MSHYAGNFLIYAATGLNFRSELRALVRRACPCLVTCFRRAAGTGSRNTTAAGVLEMRQTNTTLLRDGNGSQGLRSERQAIMESRDRKRQDSDEITSSY